MNTAPTVSPARASLISVFTISATVLYGIDATIANVALPHMQATVGATQEQIAWVLTSYVVASAISVSLTSFLVERFGRTRVYIFAVAGFTLASMMCGASQTLTQIVISRLLQGACGASLIPLSQAVLVDIYPREKQGPAMALWGVGVMIGPILGPAIGGVLTDISSWRWVFFINLPIGIVAFAGLAAFLPETARQPAHYFDGFGFGLLAIAIGSLQLMLDRGQMLDWFDSTEIILEAAVGGTCLYLFIVHMLTAEQPFFRRRLFQDSNFVIACGLMMVMNAGLLASSALLPTMLQSLMGYPVAIAGFLMVPRGVGTMVGMMVIGRVIQRMDTRLPAAAGFLINGLAMWQIAGFTLDTTPYQVAINGLIHGLSFSLMLMPLNMIGFMTLDRPSVTEGAAIANLLRNVGSSIGISIFITLLAHNSQANHEVLTEFLTPFSHTVHEFAARLPMSLASPAALSMLENEVTRQASMTAYVDDFLVMAYLSFFAVPLVFILRPAGRGKSEPEAVGSEA